MPNRRRKTMAPRALLLSGAAAICAVAFVSEGMTQELPFGGPQRKPEERPFGGPPPKQSPTNRSPQLKSRLCEAGQVVCELPEDALVGSPCSCVGHPVAGRVILEGK